MTLMNGFTRIAFCVAAFAIALPSFAQKKDDTPASEEVEPAFRQLDYESLVEQWQARQRTLFPHKTGAFGRADLLFKSALRDHGVHGLRGMPQATELAHAAIANTKRALEQDRLELAKDEAALAKRLAPDLPSVYTNLANVESKTSSLTDTASAYLDWAQAMWRFPDTRISLIARATATISAALIIFLIALAALFLLRSMRLLTFDIYNILPLKIARWQIWGAVIALAFLPLLFGIGPLFTAFVWLSVCFLYLGTRERMLVIVLALLAAAVPMVVEQTSAYWTHTDSRLDSAIRAYRDIGARESRNEVASRGEADRDLIERTALAQHAFREGRVDDALLLYRALSKSSDEPWVANNLGVVLAVSNNEQEALDLFAAAGERRLDAGLFNASLVHQRNGRNDKGATFAAKVSNDKVESYRALTFNEGKTKPSHNAQYVMAAPDFSIVASVAKAKTKESARFSDEVMNILTSGLAPMKAGILGLFFLIFWVALRFVGPRLEPSIPCRKCGQPSSKRYDGTDVPTAICSICNRVFGRGVLSATDKGVKVRKEKQIAEHRSATRRMGRVLSLLLPGLGHLYARAPIAGAFIAFVAISVLVTLFFFVGPVPYPEIEGDKTTGTFIIVGVVAFLLLGFYAFVRVGAWLDKGGR